MIERFWDGALHSMTTTTSAGEPPLQRFHEGFPWGMSLGYLHRADSGDLLPAIWPTAPGGVSVTYSDVHETLTNQWLEYGVLDLLLALPPGAAQIHVFDFGIRKRFSTLAQLQAQKSYRVYSDLSEAQKGLDGIEAIACHRHHQLFDDETPTLVDFNQRASRPEPFHVLLVNLDDFPRDPGAANRLTLLLREAIPAGIYLLAYGRHTASIADEQASSSGGVSPDSSSTNRSLVPPRPAREVSMLKTNVP